MRRIYGLIFTKYPQPGAVKTRMVPPLTPREAADLHLASLRAVWDQVKRWARVLPKLIVTPDECGKSISELVNQGNPDARTASLSASDCWPQGPGDLGERMANAASRAFQEGATGVLLLGTDSPTLPMSFLELTIRRMPRHDVILGPCEDGGYYTLAMRRHLPELFERIDWGGQHVAEQTRERAREADLRIHQLPYWYDLDRVEELKQAARDLKRCDLRSQPVLGELSHQIQNILGKTGS